ncbi:MAG: aldehyde dehydrogenase family protein [Chloroflexota bacterium]|nr:aldehyde dehydrogenase family protein [Chloroflexota bacterium]
MTIEVRSYVGGEWIDGPEVPDVDPAHPSRVVAVARQASAPDVARAVEAARAAFPSWSALPAGERGRILTRAAEIIEARVEATALEFTREEGKTLAEARGEIRRAASIFRYYAGQTLEPDGEVYPSASPELLLIARREPIGVVGVITPWNFPIAIPAWKIAPALAYGNAVVWKPAEVVPLTSLRLVEALAEAGLPAGTLNMLIGKGSVLGGPLVGAGVDAVTFTGSNATGASIAQLAARSRVKAQLEMGGKNAVVVLADADVAFAADQVARGAFLSAGQKCTATSRVYVERGVYQRFVDELAALARKWRVGDPTDPATAIGPLVSEAQLGTVLERLRVARSEKASFVTGGTDRLAIDDGYYVAPTILTEVPRTSAVLREEVFGPVACVVPVDSLDEGIALANETDYGLSAALFSRDLRAALTFARRVRAGVVKINQETAGLEPHVPFGGMKASSAGGREQGKTARDFFTEWKTVYMAPV